MKYKEIGECLYKIQKYGDYIKGIEKVSEQTYNSIHKEVTRKDRTIGQAELEVYREQVSKVLEAYSKAEISLSKMREIVDKCKQANNISRDFNIGYKDNAKFSIDSTSSSIEKIEKSIMLHQDKYSELAEKLRTYKPSQEIASESISDNKRVERIKTKLEEYYPEAAHDMPEIVSDLAIAKDILMNQSYCDTIMVDLQNEMKKQEVSLNEILQKSERERGYGDLEQPENERKTYVNAIHFLKPDEFSKLAKNGVLTFDAGVTLKHGPYSHRLQLNILHHAYEEGKIKTNPVELYKKMADQRFINTEQSEYTVWVDIFDGFQLPRAFSVAGLPEDPSAWQQTHLQAYSNPFFVTEHPIETLPPGPLKKELALTRLRQLHFGLDSVVDIDTLSKRIQSKIIEIEQNKISKINTLLTGKYSDIELQAKKAQLKEELEGMNLEQLEQRYIALGRKVPASFDLEGDYGKSRDKIIRDSSNKKSALDKEK
jgi:flagellar hook-basal body complex protein FliE